MYTNPPWYNLSCLIKTIISFKIIYHDEIVQSKFSILETTKKSDGIQMSNLLKVRGSYIV